MKLNWFNSLETINWTRLWWMEGILMTFWAGLTYVVPDPPFKAINFVLIALGNALLFASRGTKYVADRTQVPPADGKP